MFGIGWTEFVVIALVLLLFVGPRQLPGMLKKVGQVIGELKYASRELRQQVSEEVREIQKDVGDLTSPKSMIKDAVDDLVQDVRSPYDDARQIKDDMREEITNLKKDFQNIGKVNPDKENSDAATDSTEKSDNAQTDSKAPEESP